MPDARTTTNLPSIIKRARDVMRKDAGLNGDADRIPQIAWLLFLKAFDDLEESREVVDPDYRPALRKPFRWRDWAADPHSRRSGDALLAFVEDQLLPHLAGLSGPGGASDARDTIAQVFRDTRNRMLSGYLLADLVDQVAKIQLASPDDVHTMAQLYESMLREMRDAAGDAGEFYTPRPVIRFMVGRVDPRPGETVMDPAVGTGGFLVEAWEHLVAAADASDRPAQERHRLDGTLTGFEKKPMPYLLGQMNLLLHEVEGPRIARANALRFTAADQRRAGVDVVLTNPPFGGEEEAGVRDYFPDGYQTSETAWLFLQSIMERISRSKTGRAAVVVPNGVLFAADGVGARIKKKLLTDFNLHTIVRLPNGVFSPYTLIPTNILFFERGVTTNVWFYEHPLPEGRKNYTKTKPLRYEEFAECEAWWGGTKRVDRTETAQSWKVTALSIVKNQYRMDAHNPIRCRTLEDQSPPVLIDEIRESLASIAQQLDRLPMSTGRQPPQTGFQLVRLSDVLDEVSRPVDIVPSREYRTAGVKSYAEGLFERERLSGSEIRSSRLFELQPGDLVYNKLFAWKGSFALAGDGHRGLVLSNEFPMFVVDTERAIPGYILHWLKQSSTWESVGRLSTGGTPTSRNRLKVEDFRGLKLSLPDLDLQRQLVDRLDAAEKIRWDGTEAAVLLEALPRAIRNHLFAS